MLNTKFGKIENNRITYAPYTVSFEGKRITCPDEPTYNALGYYRIAITPPTPPEGKRVASTTYAIVDNKLVAQYTYEDVPPEVRIISVEKLVFYATTHGKIAAIVEVAKSAGLYEVMLTAGNFAENDENVQSIIGALKAQGITTDEEVEAAFTECKE